MIGIILSTSEAVVYEADFDYTICSANDKQEP